MSQISVTNLTFAYSGSYDNVFENVSFQIDTNWRLGFTGRNGRGKTTFLNLLCGKLDSGGAISASVEFDYFPFSVRNPEKNTSEVIAQICQNAEPWEISRELSLLSVGDGVLNRPFETLSSGEQTKILLAALFLNPNHFLLIDEPTNHLDREARGIVSRYLKSKSGYILVSHDRNFLDNCIDHVLSINKQNIEIQRGNFSSWLQNKKLQDDFELAENARLKTSISRLKKAAKQSSEWADRAESVKLGKGAAGTEKFIGSRAYIGEQSRRMQQRRKNLEKRQNSEIEEKSGLLKNIESASSLKLFPQNHHSPRLITLENVSILYGDNTACEGVSFTINNGERVALQGKNGCGKSSILKLICGEKIEHRGNIVTASGLKISYVCQDTSHLQGDLSSFAEQNSIDESLFKAILRKLDFGREQFEKSIEDFSGGQKKKVLIAKSLCEKAHLYIWDEPLNFVDVLSRIQIEELILEHKPTMLFVEHDDTFCQNIATKIIQM